VPESCLTPDPADQTAAPDHSPGATNDPTPEQLAAVGSAEQAAATFLELLRSGNDRHISIVSTLRVYTTASAPDAEFAVVLRAVMAADQADRAARPARSSPGSPRAGVLKSSGGNLRVAQEALRRSSVATMQRYTRVDDIELNAAITALP
jgi:hypothetical protein